jgi:hypothetical protein
MSDGSGADVGSIQIFCRIRLTKNLSKPLLHGTTVIQMQCKTKSMMDLFLSFCDDNQVHTTVYVYLLIFIKLSLSKIYAIKLLTSLLLKL